MLLRDAARCCWGGLLLAVLGCSRSAVVVAPERVAPGEERPAVASQTELQRAEEPIHAAFHFPDDAGGTLLAKLLTPRGTDEEEAKQTERFCHFPPPVEPSPPSLPLPSSEGVLPPRPAPMTTVTLHPRIVMEESLADFADASPLPPVPALPAGRRIRVPSADVHQPIPLPIRRQPVSDRASLEDPTAEVSTAAAVAAKVPSRISKAPFLKLTVPDPYDYRCSGRIAVPPEVEEPMTGTPQTP